MRPSRCDDLGIARPDLFDPDVQRGMRLAQGGLDLLGTVAPREHETR